MPKFTKGHDMEKKLNNFLKSYQVMGILLIIVYHLTKFWSS